MSKNSEKSKILEIYSNYILRNNHKPLNVFVFCEDNGMTESDFYQYYASFDDLEADVFTFFFQDSIRLIMAEETYNLYTPKDKILALYFTFFEQMSLNRSLVLYLLDSDRNAFENLKKLWPLRREFQKFIAGLNISDTLIDITNQNLEKVDKIRQKGIEEIFWGHFLTTLKFWMDDHSASFEKTDIFIEKSLDTSFELLEIKPLKKLMDLGKFLLKEKFNTN